MGLANKVFNRLFYNVKKYQFKKTWRQENSHNYTTAFNDINNKVTVGNFTYGNIHVPYYAGKLTIGSFCSIADDVIFMTSGEHFTNHLSTYPFRSRILNQAETSGTSKGDIMVGDDVWIGERAIILSGVTIGQGAIIGAGAIVSKNVPPYAVFAGGRIVKYRFSEEVIRKLLLFDYSQLTSKEVSENLDLLYQPIDENFFETDFYKTHLKK